MKKTDVNQFTVASKHLAKLDADWADLVKAVGVCTHQTKPELGPYQALIRTVAFQQLHARAAEAILGRLLALHEGDYPAPHILLAMNETELRSCGFSARKILTLKAIAGGAINGLVPNRKDANKMPDEELIAKLTTLPGIGRWTVEMLLIYSLERMDIFPVDDFGVREGYRFMKSLDQHPKRKTMQEIGLTCSPYGTVAAWYLWRALELPDYKKAKK